MIFIFHTWFRGLLDYSCRVGLSWHVETIYDGLFISFRAEASFEFSIENVGNLRPGLGSYTLSETEVGGWGDLGVLKEVFEVSGGNASQDVPECVCF